MSDTKKKTMPQGGKKGGSMFPRIDLEQAAKYAAKLVSKTHTGAQLPATLFPGVFGASGSTGKIRSSALKQYGLMEGSDTEGYQATPLATAIASAPDDERPKLLREACLRPRVFDLLFETYHGDEVSLAKIRQQAASAKVHPDELDNCAEIFIASVVFAGLGDRDGDSVRLFGSVEAGLSRSDYPDAFSDGLGRDGGTDEDPRLERPATATSKAEVVGSKSDTPSETNGSSRSDGGLPSARSIIHVNVTLDSSLDTEKLERQLLLLRRFGAL
jgi:hypothetical protein